MTTTPNKPALRIWEAGLRSGEFPQSFLTLYDGVGYCCLGVVTELAVRAGVIPPAVRVSYDGFFYNGETDVMPLAVQEWLGIDSPNPTLVFLDANYSAVDANDNYGKSFIEIADALKRTFDL